MRRCARCQRRFHPVPQMSKDALCLQCMRTHAKAHTYKLGPEGQVFRFIVEAIDG